jgi:hypothetical protein
VDALFFFFFFFGGVDAICSANSKAPNWSVFRLCIPFYSIFFSLTLCLAKQFPNFYIRASPSVFLEGWTPSVLLILMPLGRVFRLCTPFYVEDELCKYYRYLLIRPFYNHMPAWTLLPTRYSCNH